MVIKNFLDGGKLINAKVLSISSDNIIAKFQAKAQNLTALSLGSGYVISSAVPHLIGNAFKNLASVSLAANFEIKQVTDLKKAAAAGPVVAAGAGQKDDKPKEAEKEEEEDDGLDGGMDMFGGDDDY